MCIRFLGLFSILFFGMGFFVCGHEELIHVNKNVSHKQIHIPGANKMVTNGERSATENRSNQHDFDSDYLSSKNSSILTVRYYKLANRSRHWKSRGTSIANNIKVWNHIRRKENMSSSSLRNNSRTIMQNPQRSTYRKADKTDYSDYWASDKTDIKGSRLIPTMNFNQFNEMGHNLKRIKRMSPNSFSSIKDFKLDKESIKVNEKGLWGMLNKIVYRYLYKQFANQFKKSSQPNSSISRNHSKIKPLLGSSEFSSAHAPNIDIIFNGYVKSVISEQAKILKSGIFGDDNRIYVKPKIAGSTFPFYTTAKVWTPQTRCSGTLISSWHVLTAGHCLHDGKKLLSSISAILIATLGKDGSLSFTSVVDFYIPDQWMSGSGLHSEFDYAVLRIKQPRYEKDMKIRALKIQKEINVQFSSFPGDKKYDHIWYANCSVIDVYKDSKLFCDCDAYPGSSGAGVYISPGILGVKEYTLIGILSNFAELMHGKTEVKGANEILKINERNFKFITSYVNNTMGVT